jgi:hypothetical protein
MTPEQVEANLSTACDLADFGTPESMNDADRFIAQGLPAVPVTSRPSGESNWIVADGR